MATYLYKCEACGYTHEMHLSMLGDIPEGILKSHYNPITFCKKRKLMRVFTPPAIRIVNYGKD